MTRKRNKVCSKCGKSFTCIPESNDTKVCSLTSICYCAHCLPALYSFQTKKSEHITYRKSEKDNTLFQIGLENGVTKDRDFFSCELLDIEALRKKIDVDSIDARHALELL